MTYSAWSQGFPLTPTRPFDKSPSTNAPISFDRSATAAFAAPMSSMCETCHAGCCRAYNLFITVYDALRISRDLSLPISEFVTLVAQNAEGVKRLGGQNHPIRFSDPGFEDTFFFVALKRVESRLVPGTHKCTFLQEWQRSEPVAGRDGHPGSKVVGRCGIYGSRPLMCRTYPSVLHPDGALGFISNPKPPDLMKTNPIYTLCPEKWETASFTSDPSQAVHTLVLNRYEVDFQNKLVDEWNANPRPMKGFFPYAVACYGNRIRLVPELVTEPKVVDAPAASADPMPIPE
jgi:Fe-S-cluster containining protein